MVRLMIIFAAFMFCTQSYAADCGLFKVVKGKVSFKKNGKNKFRKATKNKKVCQGATVKTEAASRAKIIMADKNEINISPNTELVIEVYQTDQKAVLNVINGKVRSNVKRKYQDSNASHYRVKTKSAVAGVRGTEFMASYNAQTNQARVVTFEGEVAVGQMQGNNFVATVTVKPGQFTSNSPGQPPHPAKEVPPQELAQMDQETNLGEPSGAGDKQPASTNQDSNSDDAGDSKDGPAADEPAGKDDAAGDSAGQDDAAGDKPKSNDGVSGEKGGDSAADQAGEPDNNQKDAGGSGANPSDTNGEQRKPASKPAPAPGPDDGARPTDPTDPGPSPRKPTPGPRTPAPGPRTPAPGPGAPGPDTPPTDPLPPPDLPKGPMPGGPPLPPTVFLPPDVSDITNVCGAACNDAVINNNQKVKVIINTILPGQ